MIPDEGVDVPASVALHPSLPEVLFGGYIGFDPDVEALPEPAERVAPMDALCDAIRPRLERAPCLVSFSGGRDSSLVLCVAALVAAREGLPPPIPVTLDFGAAEGTVETKWQDIVIEHLGLREHIKLSFTDELQAIGPVAGRVLERFGVLAPPNLYLHVPLFE